MHLLLWGTKKLCSFIAISVMCIHEVIQMGVVVFDIGLASFLINFFVIYQKKACNCKSECEHQKEKGFLCLLTA